MVKTIPIKDIELHTAFKIECAKRGVTITDAAEDALNFWMAHWALGEIALCPVCRHSRRRTGVHDVNEFYQDSPPAASDGAEVRNE